MEEILNEAGVPAMRVRTIPEAVGEPYVESRKLFHVFESVPGVKSSVTVPLVPFKLSACEARAGTPPPTLGADTEEVLLSIGYSARVAELRERGVV